jgi:hypothetical protein
MAVAEMASASAGGSGLVYEAVRQALDGFQPSEAHKLLSTFKWPLIATTNYENLIERAYNQGKSVQSLVRFVKDDEPIEERMQAVQRTRHAVTIDRCSTIVCHACSTHLRWHAAMDAMYACSRASPVSSF